MMNKRIFLSIVWVIGFLYSERLAAKGPKETWTIVSPDKNIRLTINHHEGVLSYFLLIQNDTAIVRSNLGIITNADDFSSGLTYQSETPKKIDEAYSMLIGKRKDNRDEANELTLT